MLGHLVSNHSYGPDAARPATHGWLRRLLQFFFR